MLVYLDESGDPGMKIEQGSSTHFVIALVLTKDEDDSNMCRQAVENLRTGLGFNSRHEFKFNKSSQHLREQFLKAIAGCPFEYSAFVLNKERVNGQGFNYPEALYKWTAQAAFSDIMFRLSDAVVVMDRCGHREFRRTMQKYLQRKTSDRGKRSPIKHVRQLNSQSDTMLQIADMVAGSIARLYKPKIDAKVYREIIKGREISQYLWPRNGTAHVVA